MTALSVLHIEDSDFLQFTFNAMAQGKGLHVVQALDPIEALRMLERGDAFDAAITDLSFPEMDGLELIKKIHTMRPALPILATSGQPDLGPFARKAGATDFFEKPGRYLNLVDGVFEVTGHTVTASSHSEVTGRTVTASSNSIDNSPRSKRLSLSEMMKYAAAKRASSPAALEMPEPRGKIISVAIGSAEVRPIAIPA